MKVVVVEPDEDVAEMIATILGAHHEVRCFRRAFEAMGALLQESAEVVLAERRLPDMAGDYLATVIRSFHKDTRIVLISTDWSGLAKAAHSGFEVLRKPFSPAELWEQVIRPNEVVATDGWGDTFPLSSATEPASLVLPVE
jgi:DNA-binding response OmpR family regulator